MKINKSYDMCSRLVVSGIGNNNYDLVSDITRAEFAAIMVRALGLTSGSGNGGFSDVATATAVSVLIIRSPASRRWQ